MTPPPVAVFNSAVPSFFVSEVAVKSEISFANAFAPALTIKISLFDKSVMVSVPELTLNVSLSAFPVNSSFPNPPVIISSPPPPEIMSSPFPPVNVSATASP